MDWFVLRDTGYERLPFDEEGIYRSEVFPGLWLDTRALLTGDSARVLKLLQHGLASQAYTTWHA